MIGLFNDALFIACFIVICRSIDIHGLRCIIEFINSGTTCNIIITQENLLHRLKTHMTTFRKYQKKVAFDTSYVF